MVKKQFMDPNLFKKFSSWLNIQSAFHFLTKNGYFHQNDALRAIYLKNEHFFNFQIRLFLKLMVL
jgi:hypothetical protein